MNNVQLWLQVVQSIQAFIRNFSNDFFGEFSDLWSHESNTTNNNNKEKGEVNKHVSKQMCIFFFKKYKLGFFKIESRAPTSMNSIKM